jgi:hypothetical protein
MAKRHGFWMHTAEPQGCGTLGFGSLRVTGDPIGLVPFLQDFQPFGTGHGQLIENFVWGLEAGCNWFVFDYRFRTGSGRNETTYLFSVVVAELPVDLPSVIVREQGFWDGVGGLMGIKDLQLESDDFNRRFWVGTRDTKRAYEILHPQMMEYLMSLPPLHYQMSGPWLVWHTRGRPSVGALEGTMKRQREFVAKLPAYYRDDHKLGVGDWGRKP